MERRTKRGFSLIELMVVITIIAMLAGGVAIALFSALGDAKIAKAKSDISDIDKAIKLYKLKTGKYPDSLQDLNKPVGTLTTGILEEPVPRDPWENDYFYQRSDSGFVLKSLGADGQEGGEGENADIDNKVKERED